MREIFGSQATNWKGIAVGSGQWAVGSGVRGWSTLEYRVRQIQSKAGLDRPGNDGE